MLSEKNVAESTSKSVPDETERQSGSDTCSSKFANRLRKDGVYRRKFILTLAVCWSYVNLGWVVLQIGTALPDLQLLVGIDLETASWLFTTWSLGFVMGSLLCGFLYDRVNRLVVMFVCTFGVGISSVCLPHSKTLAVMIVLRVICGLFCGGIDTGANTIVPSIWGSEVGPFMQALYLSYTVGSIASPLATEPFMYVAMETNRNLTGTLGSIVTNSPDCVTCQGAYENDVATESLQNSTYELLLPLNQSKLSNTHNISIDHSVGETVIIHKAFMMTCGMVLCSSIPYLIMVLVGDFDIKASSKVSKDTVKEHETEPLQEKTEKDVVIETMTYKIEGKRKYFVLACTASVNLLYSATEDSLGDFLVTFALDYLAWDSSSSVSLISLYWVASCIGGLVGVLLVRFLRPAKLLFLAHLLWITSFLLSLIGSLLRIDVMIWIFIPSSGFFMVLIIPAVISWTEEYVCHVTGRISSLFMISTGVGLTVNPKFIGFMMEKYTYVTFLCILFTESVICFGFYVSAYVFRHFRYNPSDKDIKVQIL